MGRLLFAGRFALVRRRSVSDSLERHGGPRVRVQSGRVSTSRSALGLLLTTSFLGLRRYLRQRKLQMPAAMTRMWLAMGTGLALALLCLALLLPQPQGEYSVTAPLDKVDAKLRRGSRFAVVPGDRAKGEGRRIGDQDPKADKAGESPPRNQPPDQQGKAQPGDGGRSEWSGRVPAIDSRTKAARATPKEKGQGQSGKQSDDQAKGALRGDQAQKSDQRATPPPSTPSGSPTGSLRQFLAASVKWLIYAVARRRGRRAARPSLVVLHRDVGEILGRLARGLRRKRGDERDRVGRAVWYRCRRRPFRGLRESVFQRRGRTHAPRTAGGDTRSSARSVGPRTASSPGRPEQTPLEFAQELGRRDPCAGERCDVDRRAVRAGRLCARTRRENRSPCSSDCGDGWEWALRNEPPASARR